jgi:S1-C subfamily serine protease
LKNNYLKFTSIIITLFLLSNSSLSDVIIQGFVDDDGKIFQFSNTSYLQRDSSIFLTIKSTDKYNLSLSVKNNNESTKLSEFSIEDSQQIIFPSNSKKIALSKSGIYVFEAKDRNTNQIMDTLTIFIDDNNKSKDINIDEFVKASKIDELNKSLSFNINFDEQINIGKRSLSYNNPIQVTTSSRSAGSRIYKQYADSVMLVATDEGIGSGVLLWDNLVLTNKHVVGDYSSVTIIAKPETFQKIENSRRIIGDVVKFDEEKDLALIQLRKKIKSKRIKLSDPKDIEVAMKAHAIGHPMGNYWSYTEGVVSQIRPSYEWLSGDDIKYKADVIQTQTPINPGNSGGPLFNSKGELIGINSFGSPDSPGLNFAVATTSVVNFLNSKNSKKAERIISKKNNECWLDRDNKNIILCDRNNSGRVEEVIFDDDGDGEADRILIDQNENGEPELLVIFAKLDNGERINIWKIDPDETGEWIAIGYDFDRDNEVDEWEYI